VSFWNLFFILLIWVPLAMIWAGAVMDIFRRQDMSGGAKALWLVVVIVLPLVGTLIYMIARPSRPAEPAPEPAVVGAADELERLAKLRADGSISAEEFATLKARVIG
jgi:heme/copper-type cytochrome/quinol oxidase subunit 2